MWWCSIRTEKLFRRRVLQLLAPVGAFPVENIVNVGCPDVATVLGWIELKVARRPVRADSVVVIGLRPAQRIWLRKWRMHGGRVWTLTLLDEEVWLLHDGTWAADRLGLCDESELYQNALKWWGTAPAFDELTGAMR